MVALGRPAFGIDLFIGEPELIGRGHGPALIRAFLRDVAFPRYGLDHCVIGPTRINYARIIPMVDYTAKMIGRLIG